MSFNFGSWMFIGICLLVVQCCLTLFYSLRLRGRDLQGRVLPPARCRRLVQLDRRRRRRPATIYSGFLLTQAVGVTLWNTALIPLL